MEGEGLAVKGHEKPGFQHLNRGCPDGERYETRKEGIEKLLRTNFRNVMICSEMVGSAVNSLSLSLQDPPCLWNP